MKDEIKSPWDVTLYINNNKNYVLELMDNSKSNNKYWIHLVSATVIEHVSNYHDPINGYNITKDYSQGDTRIMARYDTKYIPIDSTYYRVGTLVIPRYIVIKSILRYLPLVNEHTKNYDKSANGYKSVHMEFTLKDDNKTQRIVNTPEFEIGRDKNNALTIYSD